MSIPSYQGTTQVVRAARACIVAEAGAVLADAATGLSLTLPNFVEVYGGEIEAPNLRLPACGLFIANSGMMTPGPNNSYDAQHTLIARILVDGGGPSSPDVTTFDELAMAYAQAVAYTMTSKFANPAESYGYAVGCVSCHVVSSFAYEPLPVEQDGRFRRTIDTELQILQKMPRI